MQCLLSRVPFAFRAVWPKFAGLVFKKVEQLLVRMLQLFNKASFTIYRRFIKSNDISDDLKNYFFYFLRLYMGIK